MTSENKAMRVFLHVLGWGLLVIGYIVALAALCAWLQARTNAGWGVVTLLVGMLIGVATAAAVVEGKTP